MRRPRAHRIEFRSLPCFQRVRRWSSSPVLRAIFLLVVLCCVWLAFLGPPHHLHESRDTASLSASYNRYVGDKTSGRLSRFQILPAGGDNPAQDPTVRGSEDSSQDTAPSSQDTAPPSQDTAQLEQAAIVYLCGPSKRNIEDLNESLEGLEKFMLRRFPYPVIVFEDSLSEATKSAITSKHPAIRLEFKRISFAFPSGFDPSTRTGAASMFPEGYLHMCNFWFWRVFVALKPLGLQYMMRMDTDSRILGPVLEDPFVHMRSRGAVYGYRLDEFLDKDDFVRGLWKLYFSVLDKLRTAEGVTIHELPPGEAPRDRAQPTGSVRLFYNNFEIVDINAYTTNPGVEQFTDAVVQSHGIYKYRWGDAPLRWLAVRTFFEDEKVLCLSQIAYRHKVTIDQPSCRMFRN